MLTRLGIKNFKQFDDVTVELGNPVVFVGPNNSGKTSALQALALWSLGLRRWSERWKDREPTTKRTGATINRNDLFPVPVSTALYLWRDLHVRQSRGRSQSPNVLMEVLVEGVTGEKRWEFGFEFDYANAESFYCRPIRASAELEPSKLKVPPEAAEITVAFLPPMSGMADREHVKQRGEIDFLLGQGRTAEVLRNLAYKLSEGPEGREAWGVITENIDRLFGCKLLPPKVIPERSEIEMHYVQRGQEFDIACAGRGLHQTLLLLTFISNNPKSVLLLDEPDAHLEVIRQRQTYELLSEYAAKHQCQVVIASHSEVILQEAADRDVVIGFLGTPRRINDRGTQLQKSLNRIGWEHYAQVLLRGWVLYLEGSTDLAILRAFAKKLNHPVLADLEAPYVDYIGNVPSKARESFYGLRVAKPDLVGLVLCDRLTQPEESAPELQRHWWKRREIENYFCQPATLRAWARAQDPQGEYPLLGTFERCMDESLQGRLGPDVLSNLEDPYWRDTAVSEEFLRPLFRSFYTKLGLQNLIDKKHFHVLVEFVDERDIDDEVTDVLDMIHSVALAARP